MAIDTTTVPSYVYISLDNKPDYLKLLKEIADQNYGADANSLLISTSNHRLSPQELYYDEEENEIVLSFNMKDNNGNSAHVSLNIPVSDKIHMDLLQMSLKRLNKLRSAIESLR